MALVFKNVTLWGAWVAQSVKRPTSAQVMISRSVSLSPVFEPREFEHRADSSEPGACFRFCVSLSLTPPPFMLCLSLSQK